MVGSRWRGSTGEVGLGGAVGTGSSVGLEGNQRGLVLEGAEAKENHRDDDDDDERERERERSILWLMTTMIMKFRHKTTTFMP